MVEVCNCTHHRSLPLGFLTPRSEPRRLLTVDLRLSTTPGFIFHIEWKCLSAVDNKNRSEAFSNGGCFTTSRLFQRTSQLRLAPAAARRTFNQPRNSSLRLGLQKSKTRTTNLMAKLVKGAKVAGWTTRLLGCRFFVGFSLFPRNFVSLDFSQDCSCSGPQSLGLNNSF